MSYLIRNTFRTVINLNLCKPNRITVQCLQRNFSDEKTNDSEGVKKPHEKEPSAIDERNTTDAVNPEETKSDGRLGSFAKAFNKYIQPKEEKVTSEPILPFSKLLRESKFIDVSKQHFCFQLCFTVKQSNAKLFFMSHNSWAIRRGKLRLVKFFK